MAHIIGKPGIDIHLSNEEAQALIDVLAAVGGSKDTTRRTYTNAIFQVLLDAGFEYDDSDSDLSGTLHFKKKIR